MNKLSTRYLHLVFDILYTSLPGAGLLIVLDCGMGWPWPHAAAVLFTVFFQFLIVWSDKKGLHFQLWGSVVLLNAVVALIFYKSGEIPELYFILLSLEAFSALAAVICYFSRNRLWMKVPMFLLLFGCMIFFGIEKIPMFKWEVCLILLGFLLLLAEVAEKKFLKTSQKNGSNTLYLFPLFFASTLILLASPVESHPIQWNILKDMAGAVTTKVSAVITSIEYYFSGENGAYSMSFTGYDPNGKLGGSILSADVSQLSVKGIQTKSPLYLSGSIFNEYTGAGWQRKEGKKTYDGKEYELSCQELTGALSRSGLTQEEIQNITNQRSYQIYYEGIKTESLFIAPKTLRFLLPQGVSLSDESGDSLIISKAKGLGFSYEIMFQEVDYANEKMVGLMRQSGSSTVFKYSAEEEARRSYIYQTYTSLPDSVPKRVRDLADEITGEAGTTYDSLKAIEAYLLGLTYTKTPEVVPKGREFTDYFLFESKEGYCTYFATAMAVLARCKGIPTRYVEGFVTDETCKQKDSLVELRGENAHAWVEAYIDRIGWVPFEPTPGYQRSVNQAWETSVISDETGKAVPSVTDKPKKLTEDETEAIKQRERAKDVEKLFRILLRIAFVLLVFAGTVYGIVKIRRLFLRRAYAAKSDYDKIRYLMNRILSFGARYSLPITGGETLHDYNSRIGGQLDTTTHSFVQICECFQSIRFGGKSATNEDVRKFETYERELDEKYVQSLNRIRKVWYWCVK